MELRNIQSSIQKVVSAISSVLKIEVEVADRKLFRVAGTGLIKQKIWQDMSGEDVVYRQCIESGETIVIDRPGYNEICEKCSHFGNCIETGEICCPIIVNNQVIGVIGLISFNDIQRERLFNDLNVNIHFLGKMAEIIATKMKEHLYYQQQLLAEKKISTLLNYIDNGIIMLNQEGELEFISAAAKEMLNLSAHETPSAELKKQLLEQRKGDSHEGKIIFLKAGEFTRRFFATFHQIDEYQHGETAVIVLQDPEYITHVATHFSTDESSKDKLIGSHPAILKVKEMIPKITNSSLPILLEGESGTGKGFIARYIHQSSNRSSDNFFAVNCSLFSEEKLNQEFFGFTTDHENVPGKLELADEGTLFIEEIHNLPLSIQIKLLKFLENRLIFHSETYYEVNVRIIAATDQSLHTLIKNGLFRQDLYYKLNLIPITLPPLQKRKEDILLFTQYFLQKYNNMKDGPNKIIDNQVIEILLAYSWPGNIQELENVIKYAYYFENGQYITMNSLPDYIIIETSNKIRQFQQTFNLQEIEKETIKKSLLEVEKSGKRKEDAASLLGISRATLFRKIKDYQL